MCSTSKVAKAEYRRLDEGAAWTAYVPKAASIVEWKSYKFIPDVCVYVIMIIYMYIHGSTAEVTKAL